MLIFSFSDVETDRYQNQHRSHFIFEFLQTNPDPRGPLELQFSCTRVR